MLGPDAVVLRPEGLYVPEADLFLDPRVAVPRAFVSHAHADHVASTSGSRRTQEVYWSKETAALVGARRGPGDSGPERSIEMGSLSLETSVRTQPIAIAPGVAASLAPAGHMLGAAQLVLDLSGGRLVYSGDYQSGPGLTHAVGAPVACDLLILESTFALPLFHFPDREAERARLVTWCKGCLARGDAPVVLAYAAGKSEEILAALTREDVPVVAHGAVYRVALAYEALGVDLGIARGLTRPYVEEKKQKDKRAAVLVTTPRTHSHPMVKKRPRAKVAYVSGFALLDAPLEQHRADAGFVLSDHADHDDLIATAVNSGARHVIPTHGDAPVLAAFLEARGIRTSTLDAPSLDAREGEAGRPEESP